LAYRTLDQIEAHPETWKQHVWRCDTGMCFAGWAAELAGGTWINSGFRPIPYMVAEGSDDPRHTRELDNSHGRAWETEYRGKYIHVPVRAQALLGLDDNEMCRLFDGHNDLPMLRSLVADIFGPRPEGEQQ
jgi:hypothetical protein